MHPNRVLMAVLAISIAILSCNAPSAEQVQSLALTLTAVVSSLTPGVGLTPSATPIASATAGTSPTPVLGATA